MLHELLIRIDEGRVDREFEEFGMTVEEGRRGLSLVTEIESIARGSREGDHRLSRTMDGKEGPVSAGDVEDP